MYTVIVLVSGIAPKKYLDRHIIKPKKIATMNLNLEEVRIYISMSAILRKLTFFALLCNRLSKSLA